MILVTGASQGIGFACAEALLERTPNSVLITGRSAKKLEDARISMGEASHNRLMTMVSDQSIESDVHALIARLDAADSVEGAILAVGANPAFTGRPCRIHALDDATITATVTTNCTHALMLTAALLDRFRRQRTGALVWIGSQAGAAGPPGSALYSATKSFLSGLARAAHHEYAARGIRVHLAQPGLVRTPRTAAVVDAGGARYGLPVAEAADVARRIVDLLLAGDLSAVEVDLQ